MTPYFEKGDQHYSSNQRFRSSNSSRASRHYIETDRIDNDNKYRGAPRNGDYHAIPIGSRRIPSAYSTPPGDNFANNSYTSIPRSRPEVFQSSPIPPNNNGPLVRPGSPGPVAGSGEITNTEHGFTIELDVFRFRPEEIKVVLTDDLLSISGERFEYAGDGQTLRRSFSRKYSIPEDIHLDSIRSHLTDSGVLVINGSRRGWRETSISTYAPKQSGKHSSNGKNVISTV